MEKMKAGMAVRTRAATRTRSVAFVGLTIAIMAVSAWITIPLGPVPLTLQMFALTFAIVMLTPGQCMAAVAGYLALGAAGVPVLSGMRGGIGVLAGPTGGFLWGYVLGAGAAVLLLWVVRSRKAASAEAAKSTTPTTTVRGRDVSLAWCIAAGLLFTAISYVCGWAQFMAVAGVGPEAAFLMAIAPFIVVDMVKVAAAAVCARAVRAALR